MVVRGVALGDAIVVVAVLEVVATPEVVAAPEVEAESPTSVRGRTPVDVDVGVGMGRVGGGREAARPSAAGNAS